MRNSSQSFVDARKGSRASLVAVVEEEDMVAKRDGVVEQWILSVNSVICGASRAHNCKPAS